MTKNKVFSVSYFNHFILLFGGACNNILRFVFYINFMRILFIFLEPPGPVRSLMSTTTTSDSVTISWDRPPSLGGRTDYYYSIEHSDPRGSASSTITANSRLENTNSRVTYTVSNLLPFETYNIRVIAHNGVSDQEPSTAGSRTRAVDVTTSEAGKL